MAEKLTWKRDVPGRQVSTCGRYAVAVDGYERGLMMDPTDLINGIRPNHNDAVGVGGEWAAIRDPNGADDNLDWFPTMKEAKAECQRHADRQENR